MSSEQEQHNNNNNSNNNNNNGDGNTVTVEFNTEYATAHRFPAWMALTVFSAVCLAALQSRRGLFDPDGAGEAWVLAVCIISFLLSLIAVAAYLMFRGIFVGQLPEVAMISLLIAFWAAGLPTIMNPSNDIAVSKPLNDGIAPIVSNANLYFFAWLSFAACIFLSGSLLQEFSGLNVRDVAAKAARWYGLTAASLVVMGSAVRTFRTSDCKDYDSTDSEYCKRTKFGVSIGVVGFFLAGGMTYLLQKKQLTMVAETVITTLQLVFWCFGVGYITFGTSPGATIGNLYFSTWIAFILTVFLFAVQFREYVAGREAAAASASDNGGNNTHPDNNDDGGVQAEFDDNI